MKRLFVVTIIICLVAMPTPAPASPMSDASTRAAYDCDLKTLTALIAAGVDLNEYGRPRGNFSDRAPLFWAVEQGCIDGVRSLLESGVEVDLVDDYGRTPLWAAAEGDHKDIAKLLLAHGANPNRAAQDDDTPLSRAATEGHAEMITILASAGPPKSKSEGWDRVITQQGDILQGEVITKSFTVETVIGPISLTPSLIRAIYWHPENAPSSVSLFNGDRLVGSIKPDKVVVLSKSGQELEVAAQDIKVIHFWPK